VKHNYIQTQSPQHQGVLFANVATASVCLPEGAGCHCLRCVRATYLITLRGGVRKVPADEKVAERDVANTATVLICTCPKQSICADSERKSCSVPEGFPAVLQDKHSGTFCDTRTYPTYSSQSSCQTNKQTNSVAFSPQANRTDLATATCRRNLVRTFADRGVSRGQRGRSPTVVNLSFLDRLSRQSALDNLSNGHISSPCKKQSDIPRRLAQSITGFHLDVCRVRPSTILQK
jgi:hypothetical protein